MNCKHINEQTYINLSFRNMSVAKHETTFAHFILLELKIL